MNPRANLARVADALGPLLHEVVFVGGATVDLLVTDRASGPPRFTEDIDVIVRVATRADYYERVETSLRARGFKPDMREDAPICRWVLADLTIDVMPTDQTILGFSNRWYEDGITHAVVNAVAEGVTIRVLSAPLFIATKLEAFKGRGHGDYLASADIEDIVRVVDGRPELAGELSDCHQELREYLRAEFVRLLDDDEFLDALPAHMLGDAVSQARAELVLDRLRTMSADLA
jgi:predicted nucleotidyltransferase